MKIFRWRISHEIRRLQWLLSKKEKMTHGCKRFENVLNLERSFRANGLNGGNESKLAVDTALGK